MAYRNQIKQFSQLQIPEDYYLPEWITEVKPKKTPYIPQFGDELVFIRQGYLFFLKEIAKNKEYKCDVNEKCWQKNNLEVKEIEYVKIINLNYEIKPPAPHMLCLELCILESKSGPLTNKCFSIKYHDMPNMSDFLLLKQTYENSISIDWKPGTRFLSTISDVWWHGTVESQEPLDSLLSNSLFMSYWVNWDDTDERQRLSPWDMEYIETNVKWPCAVCNKGVGYNSTFCRFCGLWVHKRCSGIKGKLSSVADFKCKRCKGELNEQLIHLTCTPEGTKESGYQLKTDEWFKRDPKLECERIVQGLSQIMDLTIAEPFLDPVNLDQYAFIIDYPIGLNTIKRRLENRFYRRIRALLFDVLYIAKSAEKFYVEESTIVLQARLITYLCSTLIMDDTVDLTVLYSQLLLKCMKSEQVKDEQNLSEPSKKRARVMEKGRKKEVIDFETEQMQIKEEWDILCNRIGDDIHKYQDGYPSMFTELSRFTQHSLKPVQEHCPKKEEQTLQFEDEVIMDWNVRIGENYITKPAQIEISLKNTQKFLASQSNMYSEEKENDASYSITNSEFMNSVSSGSESTIEVEFNTVESHCNDEIKDFVAKVSSIENVYISYKPVNECVMCYEKFDPIDVTVMYQPLRTKITCNNCSLTIYTIISLSYMKKNASENTFNNNCKKNSVKEFTNIIRK